MMDGVSWLIVLSCVTLETVEQSLYRIASRTSTRRQWFIRVLPAIILHGIGLALWMLLLKRMPLGRVLPLMGATYVMIVLAGRIFFGERLHLRRWAGVLLVACGFALVASEQS